MARQSQREAIRRRSRIRPDSDFIPVERREDIPRFGNELEEHLFWSRHRLAGALLEEMQRLPDDDPDLPPVRGPTRPVSIRFDADVLHRIKAVAAKKRKGYQTLLKEFVMERLHEEEKREGLVA